ncbi:MAG TPA: hypothetical protein VJN71_08285 [Nitrososphaerales archaeon]|nr:hypothetical protein [Nitrososphaerales archaeon]
MFITTQMLGEESSGHIAILEFERTQDQSSGVTSLLKVLVWSTSTQRFVPTSRLVELMRLIQAIALAKREKLGFSTTSLLR